MFFISSYVQDAAWSVTYLFFLTFYLSFFDIICSYHLFDNVYSCEWFFCYKQLEFTNEKSEEIPFVHQRSIERNSWKSAPFFHNKLSFYLFKHLCCIFIRRNFNQRNNTYLCMITWKHSIQLTWFTWSYHAFWWWYRYNVEFAGLMR